MGRGCSGFCGTQIAISFSGHRIIDHWQPIAGYAFQDAEIIKTTASAAAGLKTTLVPEHRVLIWNKYDFTPQWAAAIGMIHQTKQFASIDNTLRLKGYARFDGAVYYNIIQNHRLQLNVENFFDKNIQTAHNNNNIQPVSPQTIKVSLIGKF